MPKHDLDIRNAAPRGTAFRSKCGHTLKTFKSSSAGTFQINPEVSSETTARACDHYVYISNARARMYVQQHSLAGHVISSSFAGSSWASWGHIPTATKTHRVPFWAAEIAGSDLILPSSMLVEEQTTTLWSTITVTVIPDNPSMYTDYILYPPSASMTAAPSIKSDDGLSDDSPSPPRKSASSSPSPSLRSPSLFPPNGLADTTMCQCAPGTPVGIYCGYCSQIRSCKKGSSCWASAYSCGDACMDFGFLAHCAKAARTSESKANCPFYDK